MLLQLCPDTLIPTAVADEILCGPLSDPAREWISGAGSALVQPVEESDARVLAWDLGPGETGVISLACARPGSEVVLDDLSARNCARALGLPVRETLGIVLLAKREGLIEKARPVLDDLLRAGLHIEPTLMQHVLRLAQEQMDR